MIFKQFYLPCLAHASYIIGDEATGTASVVDPILVYGLDVSDAQPHTVLTGDTLFVGDVGRPDLRVALGWSATELSGMLDWLGNL